VKVVTLGVARLLARSEMHCTMEMKPTQTRNEDIYFGFVSLWFLVVWWCTSQV